MAKWVVSSGHCLGCALALTFFALGIILTLTGWLAIIGIPLCLVSLFIGDKKSKVWRCRSCRSIAPRG